jgi:hypothetical protein
VISVEVGDEDGVDVIGIDGRLLECDEGRGAAVNKAPEIARLQEDTGLESASASKRIASSQEAYSHSCLLSPTYGLTIQVSGAVSHPLE